MTEKAKQMFLYLREHKTGATSQEVADALGWTKRQADGVFTTAIQRKNLGERVVYDDSGVKYLTLNLDGYTIDLDEEST